MFNKIKAVSFVYLPLFYISCYRFFDYRKFCTLHGILKIQLRSYTSYFRIDQK